MCLFQCFKEANEDQMCSMIEKAFNSRKILLGGQVLDTNDLYSVTVLFTQSSIKIWLTYFSTMYSIMEYVYYTKH